jgi:hypothetical protein
MGLSPAPAGEGKMADDLKRMLDDAMQRASDRDSAKKTAKQKAEEAARASGSYRCQDR